MEMEGCQRLSHLVPTPQWRGRAFAPPCACGVQGRLLEEKISPAEEPAWRRPAPGKLHRLHPTPFGSLAIRASDTRGAPTLCGGSRQRAAPPSSRVSLALPTASCRGWLESYSNRFP